MSIHPQLPVPLVTLVKTEPPTVIKNEPLEEALEEEISTDIKDIEIVYHPLSEDLIKSEAVLEDILENEHLESVQTQVLVVKTENSPFIKIENITQRNKSEDTCDGNVSKGTGQGVVEVRASNEHSNALSNLEADEQSVFNISKNLNGIRVRSRKSKSPKKKDFGECYKTDETTLWEKEKEKIKVIKAPVIPVEAHEYTSLGNDRLVCNHCQQTYKKLKYLKYHIERMHRKVSTMYQCPYCSYKSKCKYYIKHHITLKHKNTKDIQWFQCHLCEKKFKLKRHVIRHNMTVHLRHIQKHKDTKDIEWFQCNLCEIKFKLKSDLTKHKKVHLIQEQMQDGLDLKCYHCEKCNYKTYRLKYLKNHKLVHLKPEEIQYLYCYHCCYKSNRKSNLKNHIFSQHFKIIIQEKRYGCNKCDYETYKSSNLNIHKLTHLKPEEIQYFYCYHCSYKTKWKGGLRGHIFRHFEKEQVKFDCYICNFVTPKRESIIKHIKKHSKVQNKSEINEGS